MPAGRTAAGRLYERAVRALDARVRRLARRGARQIGPPDVPSRGPRFALSDGEPSFAELETIVSHPEVMAAVERVPEAALVCATLDPPRVPRGAESLGAPMRRRPVRVYDLFPFSLELDLLELRLHELDAVVDVFVAVEATRGFGGPQKPLFLERNMGRFAGFRDKLVRLVVDCDPWTGAGIVRRRTEVDWRGEVACREALWRAFRTLDVPRDSVVLFSDVDEIPPRNVVHWLREHAVPLPLRLRLQTLRYGFRWYDPEVETDVLAVSPAEFAQIDAEPLHLRRLHARTLHVRGSAHLTAFLHPMGLLAKLCLTTEWSPALRPHLEHGDAWAAHMIGRGHWFGRPMRSYDAERDAARLVPTFARANAARYAPFWS